MSDWKIKGSIVCVQLVEEHKHEQEIWIATHGGRNWIIKDCLWIENYTMLVDGDFSTGKLVCILSPSVFSQLFEEVVDDNAIKISPIM